MEKGGVRNVEWNVVEKCRLNGGEFCMIWNGVGMEAGEKSDATVCKFDKPQR